MNYIICTKCQEENPSSMVYCFKCGANLSDREPVARPPAVSPESSVLSIPGKARNASALPLGNGMGLRGVILWVVATMLAGGFIGPWISQTLFPWPAFLALPDSVSTSLAPVVIAILNMSVLGFVQALVLRNYYQSSGWWIVAMAGSGMVSPLLTRLALNLPPEQWLAEGAVNGIIIGVAQWLTLKYLIRAAPSGPMFAGLWLIGNVMAWILGHRLFYYTAMGLITREKINLFWLGWVVVGLVTAYMVVRLSSRAISRGTHALFAVAGIILAGWYLLDNSGFWSGDELAGRSVIQVLPKSSSGYIYQIYYFRRHGKEPDSMRQGMTREAHNELRECGLTLTQFLEPSLTDGGFAIGQPDASHLVLYHQGRVVAFISSTLLYKTEHADVIEWLCTSTIAEGLP